MTEETNKTIDFEEVLDKLMYKEEYKSWSKGQVMQWGGVTYYNYTTYYCYLDKNDSITWNVGKESNHEYYCPSTYTEINERQNAVSQLQYSLIKKLFLEETASTSASDAEKIKALQAKEKEILACKGPGLAKNAYLKFYSYEQMTDLIEKTIKEKDEFLANQKLEEQKRAEKEALKEQKRKEREDRKTARKQKTKEVADKFKETAGKVVETLTSPVVAVAEIIENKVNKKKAQKELAKIKNNLGKDL